MDLNNIKNSNRAFLLAMFLPQIISILLITIFASFSSDLEALKSSYLYLFSMMLVAQVAFATIYLLYIKKCKIKIFQNIKTESKKINLKNVLFCILISIIAVFGLVYFVGLFDKLFGLIGYVPPTGGLPNDTFGWFFINVLISAVLPAIFEELVFRSIIFKGLQNLGFWFAAGISSVMFMFVHMSLGSIVYPIIMGIIFCLVVKKTGSVIYSMIIHFCNNFIVLLVEYISNSVGNSILPEINVWWQYMLSVVVAVLAFAVVWFIIKKCLFEKQTLPNSMQENENLNNQISTDLQVQNQAVLTKHKKISVYYHLFIGFVFWLIMIILSLVG